jgi:inosose dehydratase
MAIQVASAPVSWGIFEFTGLTPKFSADQVLDEIAGAGYVATDLGPWGYLPTDAGQLRDALTQRGLSLVSAFVPIRFADASALEAGTQVVLRTAELLNALGSKIIVLSDDNLADPNRAQRSGRIRPEDSLSAEGWQTFATGVNHVAQQVMDRYGMAAAFHHHGGGYIETPDEIARFMELTKPELVGLCLDTGHYALGGGDPVEAVKTFGKRINLLHFKDCDPAILERTRQEGLGYMGAVEAGIFCELGKGSVDFPAVTKGLLDLGYEGYGVVEQDILPGLGTPYESAKRNRAYLRSIGL